MCNLASVVAGAQCCIFLQQRNDAHGNQAFQCIMLSYSASLVNKHDTRRYAGSSYKVCRHMQLINLASFANASKQCHGLPRIIASNTLLLSQCCIIHYSAQAVQRQTSTLDTCDCYQKQCAFMTCHAMQALWPPKS